MPWHHSGKEAGGSEGLLPWHMSCVRSDVLRSPAGVDSCFHFSVSQGFGAEAESYYEKMNWFFCLLGVSLVPTVSPSLWCLSPHS